jgi:zinc protease
MMLSKSRQAKIGALLVALGLSLAPAVAQTPAAPSSGPEIRLADNVFVVPDKYAKTVTGWVVIRAGCADEAETCQGVAHYLEHLLFINRDADHKSKVALFPAGNGNGWTSHTGTGYIQSFPVQAATKAASLDKLVAYLAGLLQDVRADEAQASRERNIVLQEHLSRVGNSAQARFGQKRTELLLPGDPLGKSVGGDPDTIKAFDIPRATQFQKTWYAVNNAAFVFAGPLDSDEIKPLVEKYITPLTARPVPQRPWHKAASPPATRQTLNESDKDVKQPVVTYDKVVSYTEPETEIEQLTLNAARSVVGSFFASRLAGSPLNQMIDRNELIATGGFSLQKLRPGMMRISFSGSPTAGVTPQRLSEAVRRYLDTVKPDLISPEYLARLKKRSAVGRALLAEEPSRYASSLVSWLTSPYDYAQWRDRADIDTRLDIQHVNQILKAVAKPGRDVVGLLSPANDKTASKP